MANRDFHQAIIHRISDIEINYLKANNLLLSNLQKHINVFKVEQQNTAHSASLMTSCRKLIENIVCELVKETGNKPCSFYENEKVLAESNILGQSIGNLMIHIAFVRKLGNASSHEMIVSPVESECEACICSTISILQIILNSKLETQQVKHNDWKCDCGFNNFESRLICKNCNQGKVKQQKFVSLDWICGKCQFENFRRNVNCKKCGTSKGLIK